MTKVTIHKCSTCGDYRRIYIQEDGYKERLFDEGDEYHNNISVVEKTLLEAMAWFNIACTKEEIAIECEFACD